MVLHIETIDKGIGPDEGSRQFSAFGPEEQAELIENSSDLLGYGWKPQDDEDVQKLSYGYAREVSSQRMVLRDALVKKWNNILDFAKKGRYTDADIKKAQMEYTATIFDKFPNMAVARKQDLADRIQVATAKRGIFASREAEAMYILQKQNPVLAWISNNLVRAWNTPLLNVPRALSERGVPFFGDVPEKIGEKGNLASFMDEMDAYAAEAKPMFYEAFGSAELSGNLIGTFLKFAALQPAAGYMTAGLTTTRPALQAAVSMGLFPLADVPLKRELESGFTNMVKQRGAASLRGSITGLLVGSLGSRMTSELIKVPTMTTMFAGTTYAEARWLNNQSVRDSINAASQTALMIFAYNMSGLVNKKGQMKADLKRIENRLAKDLYNKKVVGHKTGGFKVFDIAAKRAQAKARGIKVSYPRTLTLYRGHGIRADDFVFDPGSLGAGQYWTTSKQIAKSYGPKIEKQTITLENPLVLSSKQATKLAGSIVKPGSTSKQAARARRVSKSLRAKGYDSVIVEGYDTPMGDYTVLLLEEPSPAAAYKTVTGRLMSKETAAKVADTVINKSPKDVMSRRLRGVVRMLAGKRQAEGRLSRNEKRLLRTLRTKFPEAYSITARKANRVLWEYTSKNYVAEGVAEKTKAMLESRNIDPDYYKQLARQMLSERPNRVAARNVKVDKLAKTLQAQTEEVFSKKAQAQQAIAMKITDEAYDSVGLKHPKPVKPSGATRSKKRSWVRKFHNEDMANPETLIMQMFNMDESSVGYQVLFGNINRGRDMELRIQKALDEFNQRGIKAAGLDTKTLEGMSPYIASPLKAVISGKKIKFKLLKPAVPTVEYRLESGKRVKLTRANIMDMYMHAQSLENVKEISEADYVKLSGHKIGKVSADDVYNIAGLTTGAEQIYLNKTVKPLIKMLAEFGNIVSLETDGVRNFKIQDWWHRKRVDVPAKMRGKSVSGIHQIIEDMAMFKQRHKGSKLPIEIGDFFVNLDNAIINMSAYFGLARAVRDSKSVIRDRGWNKAALTRYGPEAIKAVKTYIERVEDSSYLRGPLEDIYSKMLRTGTRGVLGFRFFKVSPKQFVSYLNSADELGVGRTLKGLAYEPGKVEDDLMSRFIPQLWMRYKYNRITRELGEIGQTTKLRKQYTGKLSYSDQVMRSLTFADKKAIGRIVHNVTLEIAEKYPVSKYPDMAPGSAKWGEVLNQRTMQVVRRTQPSWDPKDRSVIGGNRNPFVKLLTMFWSQKESSYNMLLRANMRYDIDGNKEALIKTYGLVLTSSLLYAAIDYGAAKFVYRQDIDNVDLVVKMLESVTGLPYATGKAVPLLVKYSVAGLRQKAPPMGSEGGLPEAMVSGILRTAYYASKYVGADTSTRKGRKSADAALAKSVKAAVLTAGLFSGTPVYGPYMYGAGILKGFREGFKKDKFLPGK